MVLPAQEGGGLVVNRNRTAILRWWGRGALVRWMKERGSLGGCWAARWGPATSPCSKPSAHVDFGVVSCSFTKNGGCRGSARPSLHPWSSASAPGELTAPSARLKAGAVGGVPEVPQVLPTVGSPHSLPHSPLGWVSTAGFLFAAQHSGTEAPQTPFRGGQPHAVLFPLLEAKEQGCGCPLILPKVQSSLSSTL